MCLVDQAREINTNKEENYGMCLLKNRGVPLGQEMGAVTTGSQREKTTAGGFPQHLFSLLLLLSSSPPATLHTSPIASLRAHITVISPLCLLGLKLLVYSYMKDEQVYACVCNFSCFCVCVCAEDQSHACGFACRELMFFKGHLMITTFICRWKTMKCSCWYLNVQYNHNGQVTHGATSDFLKKSTSKPRNICLSSRSLQACVVIYCPEVTPVIFVVSCLHQQKRNLFQI